MIELEDRVALLTIVLAAILAAGITALVQPGITQNLIASTGRPTSTSTVTSTTVSTTIILTSTKVTNTETITTATTSTSTVTATATVTVTSTVTTTVTATATTTTTKTTVGAPGGNASATPQIASIDLISIQNGRAAAWSKTTLSILITTNSVATSAPDVQAVNAAGGAINQWRSAIAQFTKNYTQYAYLNKLTFKIYVQGVNDTALKSKPDIRILFTDTLPSLLGDTQLLIMNTPLIGSVNATVAVQGLNTQGVQNVLVHEFGHALGLNHTSINIDAMYGEREKTAVSGEKLCPSTLDLYALASIYQWIPKVIYTPYSGTSVTLPQTITYQTISCGK
ncbi:MAG: hypothetical protein M1503_04685 [Thaumarchaeota archaeon]|nr:hypothetical protein [Nitrososphaerota archaeon]MCL5317547.1 hypothetical protein [Nitrososphaerota archaeon]